MIEGAGEAGAAAAEGGEIAEATAGVMALGAEAAEACLDFCWMLVFA